MNARKRCALNYLPSSTVPLNRLSKRSTTTERSKLADPSRVWVGGFNLESLSLAAGGSGAPTAAGCETSQSRRTLVRSVCEPNSKRQDSTLALEGCCPSCCFRPLSRTFSTASSLDRPILGSCSRTRRSCMRATGADLVKGGGAHGLSPYYWSMKARRIQNRRDPIHGLRCVDRANNSAHFHQLKLRRA